MEPTTPYSLLLAARDGQPEAWDRFVHLYGPLIYRWVRRSGMQSCDASDVTQDVLMSVNKDSSKFDPTRATVKFRAWLWTITRRRIADSYRNRPDDELLGSAIANLEHIDENSDPPTDANLDRKTVLQRALAVGRPAVEDSFDIGLIRCSHRFQSLMRIADFRRRVRRLRSRRADQPRFGTIRSRGRPLVDYSFFTDNRSGPFTLGYETPTQHARLSNRNPSSAG